MQYVCVISLLLEPARLEKLKGSPVSESIFSYSQLVGLVLIVSIFVFVIYNDLSQHVF